MDNTLITRRKFHLTDYLLEIILLVLIIYFAFAAPNFFTGSNFFNILRSASFKGIIAMGMTMVIISGEIDLSVGSTVGFSSVINAIILTTMIASGVDSVFAVSIAMIITLTTGFFIGTGVATIITRYGVPSFIVTLAMMSILRGVAFLASGGFPIIGFPSWFRFIGSGFIGPIPFPVIVFVTILLVIFYVMRNTPFGRSVYAVGSNREAARLSGINVQRVKRIIFGVTTMLASGAGIMISAQVISGSPVAGTSWELDVISAVIIGGASLFGGSGTVRGTLIGSIFLAVLLNGMTLLNVNDYWQYVVRGALILAAVLLNTQIKGKIRV